MFNGSPRKWLLRISDWFDDRWSVHPAQPPVLNIFLPLPNLVCPTLQSLTQILAPANTSTSINPYEQLKARAAARREAPVPPRQSPTPILTEDGMDTDSTQDQGHLSSSNGPDELTRNDFDSATAEVNSIASAYDTTPSITSSARAFSQLPMNTKLLHLFFAIQEIRSAVNKLAHPDSGLGFSLPKDLETNIKLYSIVILAQPSLKTYEIETLVNYMMVIISKTRWGLPAGAENAPHIRTQIAKFTRQAITNRRCDWKKDVAKSVKSGAHILALAKKLTRRIPGFEIQDAFLVRLAVLRFTYVEDPTDSYWPSVNKQLKNLEKEGAEVRNGILRQLFIEDQQNYRDGASGTVITGPEQSSGECSIMAETAAIMSQTANPSL